MAGWLLAPGALASCEGKCQHSISHGHSHGNCNRAASSFVNRRRCLVVAQARQRDLHWKEHLDLLRNLAASPTDREDGEGSEPQDSVLAARQRRAARQAARNQAAEGDGAAGRGGDGGPASDRMQRVTYEDSGEIVEELFNINSGWSVEALEGDEDEEGGSDDDDLVWGVGEDMGEEPVAAGGELGMAAESILRSIPCHRLRALEQQQTDATESNRATRANARRRRLSEHKVHKRLRIVGGATAGKLLLSGRGETTRPMMEKVRSAVFNMLAAASGRAAVLPSGSRWLDLFAGTGSVGLEALSRGAGHCRFIELDHWVVTNVLAPNIAACGAEESAAVHTGRAEDFLRRARAAPSFCDRAFDYVSVCPPYLKVSYPELFRLLEGSPLLHKRSVVVVEYPQSLARDIPAALGPLARVRDRKYGHTLVAVFGPGQE